MTTTRIDSTTGSRPLPELLPENKKRITPKRPWDYICWVIALAIVGGLVSTTVTNENYQWSVVFSYFTTESILDGLVLTLVLTVASMVLGTLLGLVLAVMRMSHQAPISGLARLYITFFRGTPVLVQLVFWFNIAALYPNVSIGIPFTDISTPVDVNALMTPLTAAIVALARRHPHGFGEGPAGERTVPPREGGGPSAHLPESVGGRADLGIRVLGCLGKQLRSLGIGPPVRSESR